jgi:hypothetical protein
LLRSIGVRQNNRSAGSALPYRWAHVHSQGDRCLTVDIVNNLEKELIITGGFGDVFCIEKAPGKTGVA